MPQSQSQARVEDDASPDVRARGQAPQLVHQARGFSRIIEEHPDGVLTEGLNDGDSVCGVERVFQDRGIAQEDISSTKTSSQIATMPGVLGSEAKKARASLYSAQSWLSE